MRENLNPEPGRSGVVGLIISTILMLIVVPYSIIEYLDKTIPFSTGLYILSGVSIILFIINLYYFRSSRKS